jgi:hypothetical protein
MKKSSIISVYNEHQRNRDTNKLQPLFQKKFDTTDFRKIRTSHAGSTDPIQKNSTTNLEDLNKRGGLSRNESEAKQKSGADKSEFNFASEINKN